MSDLAEKNKKHPRAFTVGVFFERLQIRSLGVPVGQGSVTFLGHWCKSSRRAPRAWNTGPDFDGHPTGREFSAEFEERASRIGSITFAVFHVKPAWVMRVVDAVCAFHVKQGVSVVGFT